MRLRHPAVPSPGRCPDHAHWDTVLSLPGPVQPPAPAHLRRSGNCCAPLHLHASSRIAESGTCFRPARYGCPILRRHWNRSGPATEITATAHYLPRGFSGQFSVRPGSVEVNADEVPPHTPQGARMSSHQVSGAIAYQEGQGPNQVHRRRAFAVLAVSFLMAVADLAMCPFTGCCELVSADGGQWR